MTGARLLAMIAGLMLSDLPVGSGSGSTEAAAAGHRFWRILAPGVTKWAVSEVKWLGEDGTPVDGAKPLSSGQYALWSGPAEAMDGNPKTYWFESKSDSLDRWIGVEFETAIELHKVELLQFHHSNYRAIQADLQWSDDGTSWTTKVVGSLEGDFDEFAADHWEQLPGEDSSQGMDFF